MKKPPTLYDLRFLSGFTQEEAAREMDISLRTYWSWEKGKTEPSYSEMEKLKRIFEKGRLTKNGKAH